LRVQLLGKGAAAYDGRPLTGFPAQQCYGLLCYLMLNRSRPHSRERLSAQFWSEYPESASRTYLRNCLWRLREGLAATGATAEEYLLCQDGCVSFSPTARYWLDVETFEEAAAPCRDVSGGRLTPEQAGSLEHAERLYAGDLLEGIYDDWCLYDREQLRMLHLQVLCKLLAYHEQAGTYERGLDYGQRILALDPAREGVHRQMMRLHWRLGSPSEAMAQYKRCVQILRDEIGVAPTAKTRLLYEEMAHGQFDPDRWHVPQQARPQSSRPAPHSASRATVDEALDWLRRLETLVDEVDGEIQKVRGLIQGWVARDCRAQ